MRCKYCVKEIADSTLICPYCEQRQDTPVMPNHLLPGTILHGKYYVGAVLGEGGFGVTYVGYDWNLAIKVAIKEFFPASVAVRNNAVTDDVTLKLTGQSDYYSNGKESFLREARNLARFNDDNNIVDVRDYFVENNTAYIVMEYVDGISLEQYIRKNGLFDAKTLFEMMLPLMRTLDVIHKQNVLHRDISPDNIMCQENGSLKLMDFGSARSFDADQVKTMSVLLKHGFSPLEQYNSKSSQGPWTDVYSLCATIYKCITGKNPPSPIDRLIDDDLKKPSELGFNVPKAFERVLIKGLAVQPQKRTQNMQELISETESALNAENLREKENQNGKQKKKLTPFAAAGAAVLVVALSLLIWSRVSPNPGPDPIVTTAESIVILPETTAVPPTEPDVAVSCNTIAIGINHAVALKTDGTVVAAGSNDVGQCNVGEWTDIVAVSADDNYTLGLKRDGTVVATGKTDYKQNDIEKWTDIVAVSAGKSLGSSVGLKNDGTVVLTPPYTFKDDSIYEWTDIVAVAASGDNQFGLKKNGTVVVAGSDSGKANGVAYWKDITTISAGYSHVVGLRSDGTVAAAGSNRFGQCNVEGWKDIVSVYAGDYCTVGLKSDGTVVVVGDYSSDYERDISGWKDIVAVCAGANTVVGLKSDGTVVVTGDSDPYLSKYYIDYFNAWKDIQLPTSATQ